MYAEPPLVEMPDLFRTDEQEAVKALKALGLKVKVTYPIGFTPFGRVVEQSVKAVCDAASTAWSALRPVTADRR